MKVIEAAVWRHAEVPVLEKPVGDNLLNCEERR